MKIIKLPICWILGHDPDQEQNLVRDIMHDPRNWMCPCKRCGLYIMHDGAISHQDVTLTKSEAERTVYELVAETVVIRRIIKQRKEDDVIAKKVDE